MRRQLLAVALVVGCGVAAIAQRGATAPTPASPPAGSRAPRRAAEFDELFIVTIAPVPVTGGTGFPVNTLATF
jgi:hypothetical protein